jgi:hypothetical protein
METPIDSVSNVAVAIALCTMFVIVLVCAHRAIRRMSFFGETAANWVVAVCVALLSIVGLVRFFGSPQSGGSPESGTKEAVSLFDVILLPYVALALTILLVLVLLALGKVLHGRQPWYPPELGRNRRAIAEPCREEVRNHHKGATPSESSKRTQSGVSKNPEMIRKIEGTRSDS